MVLPARKIVSSAFLARQVAIKKKCIAAKLKKAACKGFPVFYGFTLATVTLQGGRVATPLIGGVLLPPCAARRIARCEVKELKAVFCKGAAFYGPLELNGRYRRVFNAIPFY